MYLKNTIRVFIRFRPFLADALRSYLKEVASAAPTLPFYYYHIPALTGSNRESFHQIFSVVIGLTPLNVHNGSFVYEVSEDLSVSLRQCSRRTSVKAWGRSFQPSVA